MAIKFTAKDQPKDAPAATPKVAKAADSEKTSAASTDAAPDGTDLFDAEAKAPAKRKPNGFRR